MMEYLHTSILTFTSIYTTTVTDIAQSFLPQHVSVFNFAWSFIQRIQVAECTAILPRSQTTPLRLLISDLHIYLSNLSVYFTSTPGASIDFGVSNWYLVSKLGWFAWFCHNSRGSASASNTSNWQVMEKQDPLPLCTCPGPTIAPSSRPL